MKSYKCDYCGKEMNIPVLTMTWKDQWTGHYCENCVETICWWTAYVLWYSDKDNLEKISNVDKNNSNNNMPNPNWRKGCESCNERD